MISICSIGWGAIRSVFIGYFLALWDLGCALLITNPRSPVEIEWAGA